MPRPDRSRLSPWIESLILSYGGEEGNSSSSGRLKAHVIGVGQMSQSQAQGSESPTGLLFLSDGVLQIPAILTVSAWEHLQEQEDRECFTSLLNTTVCIQDYRLQFHMAPEQTKCRFFLSVGELATTAAGPVKESTPCCTTLPSVRLKICKTWRDLLGQETQDSQKSQCGFDLSELLGEWQHDCLQNVLVDVRERLMVVSGRPVSPHWDVERVRFKREKCFTVPIKCLLIPEEDAQQLQTSKNIGICKPSETAQPSVDDAEWRIPKPVGVETGQDVSQNSPLPAEDSLLDDDMIAGVIDSDIRPLSNPWDLFPPPGDTCSSSEASPEATPTRSLHNPTAAESKPDHAAILTSTQRPVHSPKESRQTSEHSKGEHSYLPPYQKPPNSAKEEAQLSGSPPSWLFDTQAGSRANEGSSHHQGQTEGTVLRQTPTIHSDGRPFCYSYQVSGQNLQDFSRFKVAESWLHWAVKYLVVPKQTENPHNTENRTSNQTPGS
uniref:Shelterin complex subunit TPP1/Est3 domain-containing protein n=1 Tax=Dicentrarchus labrax TaxID=13489 RepID=A0A8C4HIX7_DICLA